VIASIAFYPDFLRNPLTAAFWRIFRHTALNFLAMHKALLQKFALSGEKLAQKVTRSKLRQEV